MKRRNSIKLKRINALRKQNLTKDRNSNEIDEKIDVKIRFLLNSATFKDTKYFDALKLKDYLSFINKTVPTMFTTKLTWVVKALTDVREIINIMKFIKEHIQALEEDFLIDIISSSSNLNDIKNHLYFKKNNIQILSSNKLRTQASYNYLKKYVKFSFNTLDDDNDLSLMPYYSFKAKFMLLFTRVVMQDLKLFDSTIEQILKMFPSYLSQSSFQYWPEMMPYITQMILALKDEEKEKTLTQLQEAFFSTKDWQQALLSQEDANTLLSDICELNYRYKKNRFNERGCGKG